MPVTPLENIVLINQNMQVPAAKQTDHQNRVEFQNLIAAVQANEKPATVTDIDDVADSKAIDPEKEHQREEAEEETGEKEAETQRRYKNRRRTATPEELYESLPYHILDIRV